MRHDVEELEHGPPEGIQVLVRRSELEKLSPGTLAFLEYRSEKDRQIILKMYGLLPGMEPRPLLGDQGAGTWNAKFYREFDMTNDRDLWTRPDGKLYTPKEVCGLDYPDDASIPFSEVRTAMTKEGFWPVYEGKHIEQFRYDIRPVDRWANIALVEQKYSRPNAESERTVFRSFASNTNERMMISVVLPRRSFCNHMLTIYTVPSGLMNACSGLFNSFAFDYLVRLKITNPALTFYQLESAPFVEFSQWENLASKFMMSSSNLIYQDQSMFTDLWTLNRAVAEAYGLTADDFEHILSTFPVFARKRPEFFAYFQERVKEWKEER